MTTDQLRGLNAMDLLNKASELRESAVRLGAEWAESQKRHHDLKEMMPSFLAAAQLSFIGFSPSQAKVNALASKPYQEKLMEMTEAERKARLLEVEYRATMKLLDSISAVSFLRNNELKLERTGY